MKVYKFGGASVKDAKGVKNIARILGEDYNSGVMLVVSAMGKTTNALETVLELQCKKQEWQKKLNELKEFHKSICSELFSESHSVFDKLETIFKELQEQLQQASFATYDYHYDQVVSLGEILSTTIVSEYLILQGLNCKLSDARQLIFTDSSYRSAKVDMEKTVLAIRSEAAGLKGICVLQGFIGRNEKGITTTLGREGSDYTAAILAYALDVSEVTIWKDVDGVYNADPKIFQNTKLIEQLSYKEAVELAFYGASIIHPKTIQPLKKKNIKLIVRSFYYLDHTGSMVSDSKEFDSEIALVIVKKNQLLLSLTPKDFSFMDAQNMSLVFQILSNNNHHINLIQNSAISFSLCLDNNQAHFKAMIADLQQYFDVRYNNDQVLISIRHYKPELIEKIYAQLDIKMEQRNRITYQILVSEEEFESKLISIINQNPNYQ